MIIDYRVYRDESFGLVGFAMLAVCAWTGERFWLWDPDGLTDQDDPRMSAHLLNSLLSPQPLTIPFHLARLQRARVLSLSQYAELCWVFERECEIVRQYWASMGIVIHHHGEIE